jgi:peptidoglycan/LPS O-acetylase OafA/YrhL
VFASPSTQVRASRTFSGGDVVGAYLPLHSQAEPTNRVSALTGLRALAVLLVVGTHAAFGTGKLTHGYVGMVYARLEIGVPIFFVLSGFLLFGPWVRAAATGSAPPRAGRYASRRVRRVMPAYVVTVLLVFLVYQFFSAGLNPGHTWMGLVRYLTLTQIYADDYLVTYLHQGLSQMWSLAVEVAFYAALPLLAYLLLVRLCGDRWRPGLLLTGLAAMAVVSPVWLIVVLTTDWLPNSSGMWLPAHLSYFVAGMLLAVLRVMRVRCHARAVIPAALVTYLIAATPIAGDVSMAPAHLWQPLAKVFLYAIIATLVVAPLALGDQSWYGRLLGSRPMVWLGEISYEIFLLHVVVMAIVMNSVLRWPVFTGSMVGLYVVTLGLTIPLAYGLRRLINHAVAPVPEPARRRAPARSPARCLPSATSAGR